jgi:hypothetical protein
MVNRSKLTKVEIGMAVLERFGTAKELQSFFNALALLVEGTPQSDALMAGTSFPTTTKRSYRRRVVNGQTAAKPGRKTQANSISGRILALATSARKFSIDDAMKHVGWPPADGKRRKQMLVTLSHLKTKGHIKRTAVGRYAAK